MAIIFCDGFDHYAYGNITDKWDSNTGGVSTPSLGGTLSSIYGRFDTGGFIITHTWSRLWKALPGGPKSSLSMGCAFMPVNGLATAQGCILSFMADGDGILGVGVTATHQLFAFRGWYQSTLAPYGGGLSTILGYGTNPIRTGVYQYVEATVTTFSTTNGDIKVYLDGNLEIDLSGINNTYNGRTSCDAVSLGAHCTLVRTDYAGALCWDDVYVTDTNDDSGAGNTGILGDVRINELMPNADGTYSEWTPSTGTDHYALVDDNPPDDDTTYVSTLTTGTRDTYTFPSVVPTYGTVKGVCVNFYGKKADSGYSSIAAIGRLGSTDAQGTEAYLGGQYAIFQSYMELDPNGDPWTIENVNASEFGPKLTG